MIGMQDDSKKCGGWCKYVISGLHVYTACRGGGEPA